MIAMRDWPSRQWALRRQDFTVWLQIVRSTAEAMMRSESMSLANWSGKSDCAPSERALSGLGWTSMRRPSAPAATVARAIGGNHVAAAGAVRRIADDGQVRKLLDDRDGGDVHRVAGVGLEGADAALAEDDVVVAAGEDVFGGEQQLFDGGGDAALEQHGLADRAELAQQVEVLHIARADLEEIDVGQHQLDLGDLHDLADDEQAGGVAGFAQQLEGIEAHALEGVGRAARFECAAAKEFRAGGLDDLRAGEDLLAAFDGAGPGHDDDFVRRRR